MKKAVSKTIHCIPTLFILLGLICTVSYATTGEIEVYYDTHIKTSSLGNYEFSITSYEFPSHEVLPIIGKEYYTNSNKDYITEVDNTPPSAVYRANIVSKVDVAFAVGDFSQTSAFQKYIPTFTNNLQQAGNNIDARVEQVETSSIDITSQDPSIILSTWEAWKQYPRDPTTSWSYIPSDRAIQDNEYHCHRQGYRDLENGTEGNFILEADIVGYKHSWNDFYGMTFRHSDSGSHYAVVWQDVTGSQCGMYSGQLTSGVSLIKATGDDSGHAVAVYNGGGWDIGNYWNLRVEMTGSIIDVYIDGRKVISWKDDSPYMTGTYGVVSVSHGSGRFKNIKLTRDSTKTLGEAISDVSWRDGSIRFIVHATDIIPTECQPGRDKEFAYTITKILNSNAYLINLGNQFNKASLDKLLNSIRPPNSLTDKGKYIYNTPITYAMDRSAEYIVGIAEELSKPTDWVLVNTEILWTTEYKDNEKDLPLNFGEHDGRQEQPQDKSDIELSSLWGKPLTHYYTEDKIFAEKWRYKHEPTFFDNHMSLANFNALWIQDPVSIFENTGKYRINYKRRDNPVYPSSRLSDAFDSYRYWSTDYDRRVS